MIHFRHVYIGLLFLVYATINIIIRAGLLLNTGIEDSNGWTSLLSLFGRGFINDSIPFFLMTLPLAAWVLLQKKQPIGKIQRIVYMWLFSAYIVLFLFTAMAEGLFWEEFHCRFNFIAVDYLVYTSEVLGNIFESYPVVPLVGGIVAGAALLSWVLLRAVYLRFEKQMATNVPAARPLFVLWLIMASMSMVFSPLTVSNNTMHREIAANGVWSLFAAFRHNQLDYRQFYPVMTETEALHTLRTQLTEPNATFVSDNPMEWRRNIRGQGPEQRLNVIQIVVESLGSVALGQSTPHINALAEQSLRFTNMKATGTRTVRGIEALTLSLPPTPGASIVRRPGNEGLFSTGSVFQKQGYDTAFIYGGFGYFDNMNAFFAGNGFRVVDRAVIPDHYKTFGNTWGVCDEDVLNAALREADASHAQDTPFYQFVLTTSNHRPFTYPEGKVDVPSGKNRTGAIKYTDYALGSFLREAATRPWFENTVFIIVADHTSGSAGKTDIPQEAYDIPCLIYSPKHIEARTVDTLCSQIDVAPTLFALLGWSYQSSFFGKNILTMTPEQGRAWVGTYQLLGRLTPEALVVLDPLKQPRLETTLQHSPSQKNRTSETSQINETQLIASTVASYQTAQDLFTRGHLQNAKNHMACFTSSGCLIEPSLEKTH